MGVYFFDQYSYLHLASGIISYFWGINLFISFILHTLFEYLENTANGIFFINKYLFFWPGGKSKPDLIINRVGDTFAFIFGWISSYYLDFIGNKYYWYRI